MRSGPTGEEFIGEVLAASGPAWRDVLGVLRRWSSRRVTVPRAQRAARAAALLWLQAGHPRRHVVRLLTDRLEVPPRTARHIVAGLIAEVGKVSTEDCRDAT